MSGKIILPKKVACAIEVLRTKFHYDLYQLIGVAHDIHESDDYEDEDEVHSIATIEEYSQGNYETIINSVVNGYDVEKTAEEKVRDYHRELIFREAALENAGGNGSQHRQGWLSVVETLNILGIKIEGVND